MAKKINSMGQPLLTSYPTHANPLSMLSCHPETESWIYNCFISLVSVDDNYDYYDFFYKNCPFIETQRISKQILSAFDNDIISFIKWAIDNDNYAYLVADTQMIKAYYKSSGLHDLWIYGYDDDNRVLHICDCFKFGTYSSSVCTYQELRNAVEPVTKNNSHLFFRDNIELLSYIKPKESSPIYQHSFDLLRVKESLQDYVMGRPTQKWFINYYSIARENVNTNTCVFGMDCYVGIRNKLKYARANGHWAAFWRQAFYIIWEHKRVMLARMHYMQKNEVIDEIEPIINLYEKVEQSASIALNLAIKYSLTGKASIITDIATLYDEVERCEAESLTRLIVSMNKVA
jgi:hypothetical protein